MASHFTFREREILYRYGPTLVWQVKHGIIAQRPTSSGDHYSLVDHGRELERRQKRKPFSQKLAEIIGCNGQHGVCGAFLERP